MVDLARRRELQDSLDRLLEDDTASRQLDARGRVEWLSHHLWLYVGRFVGFAGLRSGDIAGLRDHALFAAVEVGAERLQRELKAAAAPAALVNPWQSYVGAIDAVRRAPGTANAEALQAASDAWQAALAATSW